MADRRAAREHGDREAFLASARRRLARGIETNHVHPPPARAPVPPIVSRVVDDDDLVGTFARIATDQGAQVEVVGSTRAVPDDVLAAIVGRHRIRAAVVGDEPESAAVGEALRRLGVEVRPASTEAAAAADLGVTSAAALVAATGSVVLDTAAAGSRTVSLLPRVHLCVAPAERLVAMPGEVWGRFAGHPERLPANLVWVSGPSRTGDIEQLLTIGVHGPVALHVVVTVRDAGGAGV